jgi:hypothetical protein
MEKLRRMALEAYDCIVGLGLSDVGRLTAVSPKRLAGARMREETRSIGANGVSNAPRSWTPRVSRSEL